jgi:uncharacterized membrane protein
MIAATAMDNYPPGFNILAWVSIRLFGDGELALRLPAALCGIAGVPAVYWLGKVTAGRPAALIAAALLAVSPFAIAYAQEARSYTLLMLTATLFTGAAYQLVAAPQSRSLAMIASGVALLYSHPYGTLALVSVCGVLLVWLWASGADRCLRRRLIAATAKSLAFFVPWAVILAAVTLRIQGGFWIPRPTPEIVLGTLSTLAGGEAFALAMAVVLLLAVVLWLVTRGKAKSHSLSPAAVTALSAAAFGPLLIALVLSLVSTSIFLTRYFAGSLPPLLVLFAAAATYLLRGRAMTALTLLCVIGLAAYSWWTGDKTVSNQDWRGAANHVAAALEETDCVVVPWGIDALAVNYYLPRAPACLISPLSFKPGIEVPGTANTVYLIGRPRPLRPAIDASRTSLPEPEWTATRQRFRGIEVRTFARR